MIFRFFIGPSGVNIMTPKRLYDIMQEHSENDINEKLDHAESSLLNSQNYSDEQRKEVKHKLSNLKSEIKRRWIASHYREDLFLKSIRVGCEGHLKYHLLSRYRLKVILEVISSGHKIDTLKFESFCLDTAKLYVELYFWHPMTHTLHKILLHGPIVIEKSLLPIGMMSEEAAEARNKHFRSYRQDFARKLSRESCNLDVINRILLSSDPLITGMRPTPKKTTKPFLKETVEMLLPAEVTDQSDSSDDESLPGEAEESEEPWISSSD